MNNRKSENQKLKFIYTDKKIQKLIREKRLMLCSSGILGGLTLITLFSGSNVSLLSSGLGLTTLIMLEHYDNAREEYLQSEKRLKKKR